MEGKGGENMAKNKSFTSSQAVALERFQELVQSSGLRLVEVRKSGKDAISYGVTNEVDELLAIIPTRGEYDVYDLGVLTKAAAEDDE
jgi:hypothetical protein